MPGSMRWVQAFLPVFSHAASLWAWVAEGFVASVICFLFGLVVAGVLGFALEIGAAAGDLLDRVIRRGRRGIGCSVQGPAGRRQG